MVTCPVCYNEKIKEGLIPKTGKYSSDLVQEVIAEIDDNFFASFHCDSGHLSIGYLSKHRFDILLESGILAFLAGFHSESVLSIAGSLERLYELFIFAALNKKGIQLEKIDKAWKYLKKQSERQLGAFCMYYLSETGIQYTPDTKIIEFRNKVIHQGYIPKSDEVKNFASKVVDTIFDVIIVLRNDFKTELKNIYFYNQERANKALEEMRKLDKSLNRVPVLTVFTPSIVGMDENDKIFKRRTFAILLEEMKEIKVRYGVT
ncbi:hypothetical protein ISS37_10925 [candidate division KSB1 bacterium]|nr:hypothetical protein [candidate division KSB1 bacterium]